MKIQNLVKATFSVSLACFIAEVINAQSVNAQTPSIIYAPGWGGLCLDISNANNQGPQSGAPVQAFTCNGGANQRFQNFSDGTIRAPGWGGLCLDISNANNQGPQSGAPVQAFTCNGGANQRWVGP
ncbi:ricin-type beta-trefoil lectin domain protein [Nostoc sp. CHAB 5824]|nr:ricin-type beta-trefoil lectin domain protein [Nostoc sp. CHAB 5824]